MSQSEEPATQTSGADQSGSDIRDYLAEERTFLAWIRTILGMMGFGFIVARVDRPSLWLGTTLIVVGAVLCLLVIQRHRRTVDELNHPQLAQREPSRQGIFLARFLAVAGVATAVYLIVG